MAVLELEAVTKKIAAWIGSYAWHHGKKTLVVGVAGDPRSMLTALLCTKANEDNHTVSQEKASTLCIHMTDAPDSERSRRVLQPLDRLPNCVALAIPFPDFSVFRDKERYIPLPDSKVEDKLDVTREAIALVLSHYSAMYNGIVVGSVSRTRGILQRKHHKRGDGAADIFPLLDLYDDEVLQLLQRSMSDYQSGSIFPPSTEADLVSWAHREDARTSIIRNDQMPNKTSNWFSYTAPQKALISQLHAREKMTRHKSLEAHPYCSLRHMEGLFNR
jgi:hypothetical protein